MTTPTSTAFRVGVLAGTVAVHLVSIWAAMLLVALLGGHRSFLWCAVAWFAADGVLAYVSRLRQWWHRPS